MIDQLIIGDKASFDDYGASLATRAIGTPKKKSIKESVPYSNKTYDFSAINGELYWEERELEYGFEMTAETPEELEEMKAAFSDWVMGVMEAQIFDPFIFDYHFIGTFDSMEFEDDEGLYKTTAKVVFTAYPYKVANTPKSYAFSVKAGDTSAARVINASSHKITPIITVTGGSATIAKGTSNYTMPEGVIKDNAFTLSVGVNEFEIKPVSADIEVLFTFNEEVF